MLDACAYDAMWCVDGPQDCDCEDYCAKCSAVFTLDVNWEEKARDRPEHMRDQPVHITSADLVGSVSETWTTIRSSYVFFVVSDRRTK